LFREVRLFLLLLTCLALTCPLFGLFQDFENVWVTPLKWVLLSILIGFLIKFMQTHWAEGRHRVLAQSLVAIQFVVLNAVHWISAIVFECTGEWYDKVPGYTFALISLGLPVLMDCCETTRFETRVSFVILLAGAMLGLIMNVSPMWLSIFIDPHSHTDEPCFSLLLSYSSSLQTLPQGYQDCPAFPGFCHDQGCFGEYTLNEVRRSCLISIINLVLGSLKDSIFDVEHKCLYFVRLCAIKPGSRQVLWRAMQASLRTQGDTPVDGAKRSRQQISSL
jgi:hypothetical protein